MEKKERSQAWKDAHKAAMGRPEVLAKKSALAKRPRSQAWKDSISRSRKGKALSQEYKDKLKASWDKLTPEEKAKRAEKWQQAGTQSLTGRPNKGHQEWFASLSEEERDAFLRPWIEAGQKGRGSYEPSRPEAMVAADLQAKGVRSVDTLKDMTVNQWRKYKKQMRSELLISSRKGMQWQ